MADAPDVPALLQASLNPATRKDAESRLLALNNVPGFLQHLLRLVIASEHDCAIRLAAAVYIKNIAKLRWEEDVEPIPEQEKSKLRADLVPAVLAVTGPTDTPIRIQLSEAVSLISELDFPEKWPFLIEQLVASLSSNDYKANLAILHTAHATFRPWRAHVRSDTLFTEINFVLSSFVEPFLGLFRHTSSTLLSNTVDTLSEKKILLAQAQVALLEIYYDLTCQDLPPAIEDTCSQFWTPGSGWFHILLKWDPATLKSDVDETTPSLPSQIKTQIFEIAELFIKLYPDQLQSVNAVPALVEAVWLLLGENKLPSVADDALVSHALLLLSTAIRSGHYSSLFGSRDTLSSLVSGVIVPNASVRECDVERFEDDPLDYIRVDLGLGGTTGFGASGTAATEATTRRQGAADVLQALAGSGGADAGERAKMTTEIVGEWISKCLAEYERDRNTEGGWKAKDCAIFLFGAIASRGATAQQGVTSTNALVDVVKFFSDHVFQDLQALDGNVPPILQVDAIRFLHTFRNQLTKPQLLSVLPLLVRHLGSVNYVAHTYAAITIERVLAMRTTTGAVLGTGGGLGQAMFTQGDICDMAPDLLDGLLKRIEASGATPEKVAENDHLMKCVMRVILTARQAILSNYQNTLERLVGILGVIAKNPSNPRFDQWIFESLSALMRFTVRTNPDSLPIFEDGLFGPFTIILKQDIDQYIPYVFQIVAQMLDLHPPNTVPDQYRSLLSFLLLPASWQQKGSIPGLVKLLKAFLRRDGANMLEGGQVSSVLAVVQQRLVPSRLHDAWGIELLMGVVEFVPPSPMKQNFKTMMIVLLKRMQDNKTDKFVYIFTRFLLFTMAINVDGLGPDYIVGAIEEIQPGLWSDILVRFVIPEVPKLPIKDRKLAMVGITRLLTQSVFMLRDPAAGNWSPLFAALIKLYSEPQYLKQQGSADDADTVVATDIDKEEQLAGYQAAYSRLAASEAPEADPVAYINDVQAYLGQELVRMSKTEGVSRWLMTVLRAADPSDSFVTALLNAGYSLQG